MSEILLNKKISIESPKYEVRRKRLSPLGKTGDIYNLKNQPVFRAKMKAFQLRKDIYLYPAQDSRPQTAVLLLKAKSIGRFAPAYDVIDPAAGELAGTLSRKGLKSLFIGEWRLAGPDGIESGVIKEAGTQETIFRRLFGSPLPQRYTGQIGGVPVCTFEQRFGLFAGSVTVRFLPDGEDLLDRRLGLAAAILLCLVEGRRLPVIGHV